MNQEIGCFQLHPTLCRHRLAAKGQNAQRCTYQRESHNLAPIASRLAKSEATVIDLASVLSLAGIRNPQILLARERVVEATALRQLAAARFLPSLHFGTSYDSRRRTHSPGP